MLGTFDPGCSWSSCKLSTNPSKKDQEFIDLWDATTLAKHQHKVSELTLVSFVQSSKSSQRLSQKNCEMKPQRLEWLRSQKFIVPWEFSWTTASQAWARSIAVPRLDLPSCSWLLPIYSTTHLFIALSTQLDFWFRTSGSGVCVASRSSRALEGTSTIENAMEIAISSTRIYCMYFRMIGKSSDWIKFRMEWKIWKPWNMSIWCSFIWNSWWKHSETSAVSMQAVRPGHSFCQLANHPVWLCHVYDVSATLHVFSWFCGLESDLCVCTSKIRHLE